MADYLEKAKQTMLAYSNQPQASIMHLLNIYQKMSTKELIEKLHKSKSTILRHMDALIDTGLVKVEEVSEGRGRHPSKYFYLHEQETGLSGQKMKKYKDQIDSHAVETYLRTFQAKYLLAKEIMSQSVDYLERLIVEVTKKGTYDDMMLVLKDNLGRISFKYRDKSDVWGDLTTKINAETSDVKEFLQMDFLLPIRRLVETTNTNTWTLDGTIWPLEMFE